MYVFYKKVNFNHIYSSIIKKVRNLFEKCSSLYKKTFKIMFFFYIVMCKMRQARRRST